MKTEQNKVRPKREREREREREINKGFPFSLES